MKHEGKVGGAYASSRLYDGPPQLHSPSAVSARDHLPVLHEQFTFFLSLQHGEVFLRVVSDDERRFSRVFKIERGLVDFQWVFVSPGGPTSQDTIDKLSVEIMVMALVLVAH